jgi:hypothetical protein
MILLTLAPGGKAKGLAELKVAPEKGFEPITCRLTAGRSTFELLWKKVD